MSQAIKDIDGFLVKAIRAVVPVTDLQKIADALGHVNRQLAASLKASLGLHGHGFFIPR